MKMKKLVALLAAISMSVGILGGCGKPAVKTSEPAEVSKPVAEKSEEPVAKEEPKDEKLELTIYCGLMEDHMVKTVAEFEKATGISTQAVRMSSGEILARIRAEKDNPKASIWFGGPADAFIQAGEEGLMESYKSPVAESFQDKFKDPAGYWTGIYVGYLGFSSNQKLLDERGLKAPESWDDLLKPEFKGQISVANPGSSGTAYTLLATMMQMLGEEEGLEYMKKLHTNIKSYEKSGTAPARLAGQGEVLVGITFMHDGIKYREEGMKDLVTTKPVEGTGYEIGAVGIIKGGPDQTAAQRFVDYALSKEGQELGQTVGSLQFLTNPDAKAPELANELADTKLIEYDFDWAGKNRSEFVERWNEKVNQ